MTRKVHLLEESVIRQIAAGEVIERPASVVKELIENALDAGSKRVAVEISGSGKELIRISDDGCGMSAQDALLALERHTTSKISRTDDLEKLSTFGFRGEALPSIAAVSKMELTTRSSGEDRGTRVSVAGGKVTGSKDYGCPQGTTIEIRDLFFNTPARLKFLKSDGTEKSRILQTFEEIAAAHPEIFFTYKNESASKSKESVLPARKNPIERISELWGDEFNPGNLIPLSFQHPLIQISGWISHPQFHQATKSNQLFYINQRPIISRMLSHALYESYRDCLTVGRHPACVVFLTMDPSQVDFNVHPSKREVRFRNESQIYESLLREIRAKRTQISESPKVFSGNVPLENRARAANSYHGEFSRPSYSFSEDSSTQSIVAETVSQKTGSANLLAPNPVRVLAQFHSLYILAEKEHQLWIVDQHAAAERVLYEKFKRNLQSGRAVPGQALLIPILWNVTLSQSELIQSFQDSLKKLGFAIELFGEKTFRVTEAPALIEETEMKETLDEILKNLENQSEPSFTIEEKLMHAACRAAIKASDRLSNQELSSLLAELALCDNPHTCPHGRPITLTITRQELDRKFGRT